MDLNLVIPTTPNPNISEFRQGDRITVTVKVREGERERLQAFEGDVIRKRGRGLQRLLSMPQLATIGLLPTRSTLTWQFLPARLLEYHLDRVW